MTEGLTSRCGGLRKANFALMQLLVPVRDECEEPPEGEAAEGRSHEAYGQMGQN